MSVIAMPANEMKEHASIITSCPYFAAAVTNSKFLIKAPALPKVAHTPFQVDRHGREKVIEDTIWLRWKTALAKPQKEAQQFVTQYSLLRLDHSLRRRMSTHTNPRRGIFHVLAT
jgi:hypothetical protein